jgi:hypothetical protein
MKKGKKCALNTLHGEKPCKSKDVCSWRTSSKLDCNNLSIPVGGLIIAQFNSLQKAQEWLEEEF